MKTMTPDTDTKTPIIVIPCTQEERTALRRAAYPGKMTDYALGWIRTGLNLPETNRLPPFLISEDPDTGDIYALHTQRPRCLLQIHETNRGPLAQPVEAYEPSTQAGTDLADLLKAAEEAAAAWLAE